MSKIQKIKGFSDLFSPESTVHTHMENLARQVFATYGCQEVRVPILEKTELFARSIGEETDVVQKEMYTFADRKGRSLTMRPEATAGVLRAFIESGMYAAEGSTKLFACGPMFRYERPQKGRLRQFHQLDVEVLGTDAPQADAEVVLMLWTFLTKLGLKNLSLELNSLGCPECRPVFHQRLRDFLALLPRGGRAAAASHRCTKAPDSCTHSRPAPGHSGACSAGRPAVPGPGIVRTGAPVKPATTDGRAPSMPATTMATRPCCKRGEWASIR